MNTTSSNVSTSATTSTLPILIIHPGPHKTGTTSIQKTLKEKESVLYLDNYTDTQSHFDPVLLAQQMSTPESEQDKIFLSGVKAFFEDAQSQKKNVILSQETFSKISPYDLQSFIGPGFYYRIVIVYRRYYEWIFSVYQEKMKNRNLPAKQIHDPIPFVDIATFLNERNICIQYPLGEGFISVPINRPFHSGEVFDSYKEVFDDVAVLNYHNGKSIMESFFCEGVIDADHVCQDVKDTPGKHVNPAKEMESRRVIYEANKKNILPSNVDVKEIRDKVMNRVEEELLKEHNPLTRCVEDDVMEELFQLTMNTERRLFPEWFEEERLREAFDEFCKNKSKLCYMNMDAVYQDRGWMDFLGNL